MVNLVGRMKCFHPQTINENVVSCGRCPACKQNRINGWICRLERHMRDVDTAYFLTLTYKDQMATKTPNGLLTLDYSHVQHYFKTLRNLEYDNFRKKAGELTEREIRELFKTKRKAISYYVAGEYGGTYSRPHYHILLFNATRECVHRAWRTNVESGWVSRGNIHEGVITGASIRYALKYISKPSRLPLFQGDDRAREFSYMSKGIGKNYIKAKTIAWHKADLLNRYYVPNAGGVQTTMPRYYANKIYTLAERMLIASNLEKKSSENFYAEVCKDERIINSVLQSQKYAEYKAGMKSKSNLE